MQFLPLQADKYGIVQEFESGAKRPFLQQKYGISHGTLAGFIKNCENIKASVQKPASMESKSTWQSKFTKVESVLIEWLRQVCGDTSGEVFTCAVLLAKSQEIAKQRKNRSLPGYTEDEASKLDKNWIEHFKKRHGISSKAIVGESVSADSEAAKPAGKRRSSLLNRSFLPRIFTMVMRQACSGECLQTELGSSAGKSARAENSQRSK